MDEDEIDIRALFGVLRRQIKLIVATAIVVVALAFLYVYSLTPMYTASTLILVDPAEKDLLYAGDDYQNYGINDIRVDGEIEILKSDAVALRVVEKASLITDEEFGYGDVEVDLSGPFLLKSIIQGFQGSTSVSRRGQTYLITAQVTSQNPMRAAELTNILADAYIEHQISTKVDSLLKVGDILRVHLEEARVALEETEQEFDDFIVDNLDLIEQQTGRSDLTVLNAVYSAISEQSLQKSQTIVALEQNLQQKSWESIANSLQNGAIRELERRRIAAEQSLQTAANGSQASIDLRQELASIDADLNQETSVALTKLRSDLFTLQTKAEDAQTEIRQSVLGGELPPELLTKIYELQQGSNITRSQYDNFLTRLRDVELQAELQVADARIVSPALPPLYSSSQSKRTILMLAGILAGGLGVGLAFLNEFFIGGFTNEEQLANALKLPVAARIPMISTATDNGQEDAVASAAQVFVDKPMSQYAESIRRLRVAVDQSLGRRSDAVNKLGDAGQVIMVTSTLPGEGKSNTSLSLGRAYATSGLRTLLIDCDLRKPRIHRILGSEPNSGMLQYLKGETQEDGFEEMYQHDHATGLEILLGAGRSNVPTDQLLVGPKFSKLIQSAREVFDVIILDTPPLLPLVDGLYLSHHADVIVLAVKWASTTQKDVRSVLPALYESKNKDADLLTVLSQERSGKLGYYRKYASYYGYHDET